MSALFIYLIKANIALCLFYLAYRLGLRRLTFYTLNRFFLLTGIVFSSLFPLVDVNDMFNRHETLVQVVPYVIDFSAWQQPVQKVFTIWVLLEWVFWTGVVVMGLRLLIQLVSLMLLHTKTEPASMQEKPVRRMNGAMNPFSFFRNIYVNPELHSEEELKAILLHEHVHVREWHSADVMMGELNNVFYWFNPGAWLMKTAIKENLEFLTDRTILRSGVNARAYQYSLVQVSAAQYSAGIANNFNFSHLKNRIKMMNTSKSSRVHLYRYGVFAAVVCGVLLSLNYTKAGVVVHDMVSEVKEVVKKEPQSQDTTVPKIANQPEVVEVRASRDTFRAGKQQEIREVKLVPVMKDSLKGNVSGLFISLPKDKSVAHASGVNGANTTPSTIQMYCGPLKSNLNPPPLVVIDGVSQVDVENPLSKIDVNSIQSITVLKDKSATALYGTAGQHGVILVNTKAVKATVPDKNNMDEVVVVGYGQKKADPDATTFVATGNTGAPQQLEAVVVVGYGEKEDKSSNTATAISGNNSVNNSSNTVSVTGSRSGNARGNSAETVGAVSVYPNPSTGIVNVSFTIPKAGKGYMEVTDINGKPVYQKSLTGVSGNYKGEIDLGRFPAGTYILSIVTGGSKVTSRIVKN